MQKAAWPAASVQRDEAVRTGRKISRGLHRPSKPAVTASGWRAGVRAHAVEAHVIHPSSVAVSREHRPRQDRPARHRVAEAEGVLGVACGRGTGHCSYLTGKAPCKFEIDLPPAESS